MKLLFLILTVLIYVSCSKQSVSKEELVFWMQDPNNGLKKEKTIQDFDFEVQYKTPEYEAIINNKNIVSSKLNELVKEYSNLYYITVKVKVHNKKISLLDYLSKSTDDYLKLNNYYSFDFKNDIILVDGADTLECLNVHLEQTYSLVPYNNFHLIFKKNINTQIDKTLIIHDRYMGVGLVKFTFEKNSIQQIPKINL